MKMFFSILLVFSLLGSILVYAEDVPIDSIKITVTNLKMEVGTSQKIKIMTYPSSADSLNYDYISSDSAIATAAIGTIIANKIGKTDITVKVRDTEIFDTLTIEVVSVGEITNIPTSTPTPTPTAPTDWYNNNEISVRSVEVYSEEILVKRTIELMTTQTKQFTTRVFPTNATDQSIRWRSYDDDIATVSKNGVVTGIRTGETKIYAIANDNGRSYTITIKVIPYVRYPDSISIMPDGTPNFQTGEKFRMKTSFFPADTTERGIKWTVYGNATIDQEGNVIILDKGKITIRAYTLDYKQSALYEFDSTYSDNHFTQIKEDFGIKPNKNIIIDFDTDVSSYSASQSIFVAQAANGENAKVDIKVYGTRVIISSLDNWIVGENYVFIKSDLCDISGNKLNKNLKYKFNVRTVI